MRRIDWNRTIQIDPEFRKEFGVVFACPFKERGGVTVRDYSGNRYDGTLTNGPTRAFDKWGGPALSFDGTDDYIECPSAPFNFTASQDFSFSGWIKAPSDQSNRVFIDNSIIEKWSGAGEYPFTLRLGNSTSAYSGKIVPARFDGTNAPFIVGSTSVNDSLWHHAAFTKLGSVLTLYVDGVSDGTITDTTTGTTTNASNLFIGVRGGGTNWFSGDLANLAFYNKGLTAEQVARLYRDPYAMYWQPSTQRIFLAGSSPPATYATYLTLLGVG